MKKRFRHYARGGWTVVEVARANLYEWDGNGEGFGNERHYKEMRTWCNDRLPKDAWKATIYPTNGVKKFAFQQPKHATMFRLKWL